jgi:hypothetical protein
LRLTQRDRIITIPIGTPVFHDGGNRIVVELPDRRLHLHVTKTWSYQDRLARDITAFIDGQRDAPRDDGCYDLPWYLGAVSVLPFGIPIMTLGGALPMVAACGLTAACFWVVRNEELPQPLRLLLALGVVALGYLTTFALIFMSVAAAG